MKTIMITISEYDMDTRTTHTKEVKLDNDTSDLIRGINMLTECLKSANDVVQPVEMMP